MQIKKEELMTNRNSSPNADRAMAPVASPHDGADKAAAAQNDGRLGMALLLAGLAGWVDAAGVAGSKGIFLSFMSGNTTVLGVSLARHDWSRGGLIGLVVVLFVGGAMVGELLEPIGGRHGPSLVLGLEALFLAMGAAVQSDAVSQWTGMRVPTGLDCSPLVCAMGLQNASMHRAGGISIGLTYTNRPKD